MNHAQSPEPLPLSAVALPPGQPGEHPADLQGLIGAATDFSSLTQHAAARQLQAHMTRATRVLTGARDDAGAYAEAIQTFTAIALGVLRALTGNDSFEALAGPRGCGYRPTIRTSENPIYAVLAAGFDLWAECDGRTERAWRC